MLIVNFNQLQEQIENKIIEICSNLGNKTHLPDYYTDSRNPKTITKSVSTEKTFSLYSTFQIQPQECLKKLYDSTYVNESILKDELKNYMQSHGVWFNDENYRLGTRDLLNILSVVSAFCVYHIKFIVAPLFDHIDSTYIVYFSDDLLKSPDFKDIRTLSTKKIDI